MENPYSPPTSDLSETPTKTRAKTPKVIGIILLVLGVLGAVSTVAGLASMLAMPSILEAQEALGMSKSYLLLSSILSLLFIVWMIFISIKLIKYKDQGRKHLNYYLIGSLLLAVISSLYQLFVEKMATDIVLQGLIGSAIGLLITLLFVYLMNKEHVKASLT
jgi:membrane-associated HD superfamily phosphohydrolase